MNQQAKGVDFVGALQKPLSPRWELNREAALSRCTILGIGGPAVAKQNYGNALFDLLLISK